MASVKVPNFFKKDKQLFFTLIELLFSIILFTRSDIFEINGLIFVTRVCLFAYVPEFVLRIGISHGTISLNLNPSSSSSFSDSSYKIENELAVQSVSKMLRQGAFRAFVAVLILSWHRTSFFVRAQDEIQDLSQSAQFEGCNECGLYRYNNINLFYFNTKFQKKILLCQKTCLEKPKNLSKFET